MSLKKILLLVFLLPAFVSRCPAAAYHSNFPPSSGKVFSMSNGFLILCDGESDNFFAVENFAGNLTKEPVSGVRVRFQNPLRRDGIVTLGNEPIPLFDAAPLEKPKPVTPAAPATVSFNALPAERQLQIVTNQISALEKQKADLESKLENCRKLEADLRAKSGH